MLSNNRSVLAILILVSLVFTSGTTHGQTTVACAKVHHSGKTSLLDDRYFTQDPLNTAREVLGKNVKIKAKALFEASQKGLKAAGVKFEIRKVLLGSNQIIISTTGDHILNKMAARIFEKDKTNLVYDPDVVSKSADAMYKPELKKIFVSHNVGLMGKPDASLFHEIKHWSITTKTRFGIEQVFDSYYQKFPWSITAVEFKSGVGRYLSFQERTTWIYESKLSLRSLLRQSKNYETTGMMIHFEMSERIGQTLMITTDVNRTAINLKERVEAGKATVRLNLTNLRSSKDQISLLIFDKGMTQIHLPLSAKEKATTAEGRKQLALDKLNEIIETTEKDMKSLDEAWGISDHLFHSTKVEDSAQLNQRIDYLLAD